MKTLREVVIALAILEAGWIAFDGARAIVVGEYLEPRIGRYGGELGPWTRVARAAGIAPRSTLMKGILVGYGLVWLGVALAFARGAGWAWWGMVLAAASAFWYSTLGVPINLLQLLLLTAVRRDL